MDLKPLLELMPGDAAQIFSENCRLDFELMIVISVLIMTAAAALKVRTCRVNPVRRRLQDAVGASADKAPLVFDYRKVNVLCLQNKWNKSGFARPAIVPRKPGEAVAAIDHLFDGDVQVLIL